MPGLGPEGQDEVEGVRRVYIREAADALNRRMATLRKWETLGVLPDHLVPHRGERGWRYWTPDQIEGLKAWLKETERWPGKGLPFYNPTEKKLDEAIKMMRRPRANRLTGRGVAARPRNPSDPRARVDPTSHIAVKPVHTGPPSEFH